MNEKITPLMKQYFDIRNNYPDVLLFFQVGDFYELFFEDARVVSAFLAITLTKRGHHKDEDIPLCGIPVHALNHYLIKLIKGGFKVALCDQVSKPIPGSVVDRKVTRVLTPGTLTDASMLDAKSASYLFTFFPGPERWGLLFTELLTAQVFATSIPVDSHRMLESEVIRFFPDEIVLPKNKAAAPFDSFFKQLGYTVSFADQYADVEQEQPAMLWIQDQFGAAMVQRATTSPEFGGALNILYCYLAKNNQEGLRSLKSIQWYEPTDFLIIDTATQRHLEIVKNNDDGGRKNTLVSILDKAETAMGSRLIKKWLLRPLVDRKAILDRQEVVFSLSTQIDLLSQLSDLLCAIGDLERIVGRIALGRAQVADYLVLKNALVIIPQIKSMLVSLYSLHLVILIKERLCDLTELAELLELSICDDMLGEKIIKDNFDYELDRLRRLVTNAHQEIVVLEQKEVARTGISSLKIRYTDLSGYAFEVTKANISSVPEDFVLQQSLSNKNRYVTTELKVLEHDITRARDSITSVELAVFERIKKEVGQHLTILRHMAQAIGHLDALYGFAKTAYENVYTVPTFNDDRVIAIKQGRHPVVEQVVQKSFIANDTLLNDDASLWVLTGPNMGGKSTYLRQVALIVLMAQCGSLVPASSASLFLVDSIFTRIGSGDNLAEGKSTFLVEMEEVAFICAQATSASLIILDEVGRGTSTFDGMAIARALIEYIFTTIKARTLFATHYHELSLLETDYKGIVNYHCACKKTSHGIVFMHHIVPGAASGSFGIEVAKLARLPQQVVRRAEQILIDLEKGGNPTVSLSMIPAREVYDGEQSIIDALRRELAQKDSLLTMLNDINLDELSPRIAFDCIWKLKTSGKL